MQAAPSSTSWDWSPAAGHHKAVCLVRSPHGGGMTAYGCGVLVEHEGLRGVLTCRHGLTGTTAEVIFGDGTRQSGEWTKDKFGHDLALVVVDHPGIVALNLAATQPAVGERVEIAALTVNPKRARHFYATVTKHDQYKIRHSAKILQGDSGAPILNLNREVVGINTFGSEPAGQIGETYLYKNGGGPTYHSTCRFVRRCRARYRGRGRPPGTSLVPVAPAYPPIGIPEPPGSVPAPIPIDPPYSPPVSCVDPCVGVKAAVVSLTRRIEDLENQPPAEPGEPGAPGPPGPPGVGEPGEPGPPGAPGAPCDVDECVEKVLEIINDQEPDGTLITHYTLVADQAADYWPRVERYYLDAKEVYSQIRLIPPPATPVGTMPQLVTYAYGSPIGSFVGQRSVESALVDIERGHTPLP